MKPNLASLEMVRKDDPNELAEKFICSGTFVYQFVFPQKKFGSIRSPCQRRARWRTTGSCPSSSA